MVLGWKIKADLDVSMDTVIFFVHKNSHLAIAAWLIADFRACSVDDSVIVTQEVLRDT